MPETREGGAGMWIYIHFYRGEIFMCVLQPQQKYLQKESPRAHLQPSRDKRTACKLKAGER